LNVVICLYLRFECCSLVLITINLILAHPYIFIIMNLTPFQYPICKSPPLVFPKIIDNESRLTSLKERSYWKTYYNLVLRTTHHIIIDINPIYIIIREIRWAHSVVPFGFDDCKLLLCDPCLVSYDSCSFFLFLHVGRLKNFLTQAKMLCNVQSTI
jgi:hypothetical protein